MNCQDRAQSILLAAHGEAGFIERIAVRLHVAGCPSCRATMSSMQRASTAYRSVLGQGPAAGISTAQALSVIVGALAVIAVLYTMALRPSAMTAATAYPSGPGHHQCVRHHQPTPP